MPTSMFTWSSDQKPHEPVSNHEKILSDCCEQKRACRFLMVHNGYSASASFAAITPSELTLHIAREKDSPLIPMAICCVSFPHNGSYCAFLSRLIETTEPNLEIHKATLSVPKFLEKTNLRQSFRVPVLPEAEFAASLCVGDDRWFPVNAIDFAQTGLEIELSETESELLSIGTIVSTELRFNGETVQPLCEVRRISGRRIGLSFVVSGDENEIEKLTTISSMVIALQQVWLRNRVK